MGKRVDPPLPSEWTPEVSEDLRASREAIYGDMPTNLNGTGQVWSAMINQWLGKGDLPPLPGALVCLMMVAVKLNRLSRTQSHEDSYLDAHTYLEMAKELADRAPT